MKHSVGYFCNTTTVILLGDILYSTFIVYQIIFLEILPRDPGMVP